MVICYYLYRLCKLKYSTQHKHWFKYSCTTILKQLFLYCYTYQKNNCRSKWSSVWYIIECAGYIFEKVDGFVVYETHVDNNTLQLIYISIFLRRQCLTIFEILEQLLSASSFCAAVVFVRSIFQYCYFSREVFLQHDPVDIEEAVGRSKVWHTILATLKVSQNNTINIEAVRQLL